MSNHLSLLITAAIALIVAGAGVGAYVVVESLSDEPSRQDVVASRGAQVMPFDLDRTTHIFRKTADGGVQTVTADDPADAEQIRLIRSHLSAERARFAAGDFADPAAIHGHDMPGLAELTAGAARVTVRYGELPDGAMLRYSTTDPALVDALHAWFDAQVSDHGRHAGA